VPPCHLPTCLPHYLPLFFRNWPGGGLVDPSSYLPTCLAKCRASCLRVFPPTCLAIKVVAFPSCLQGLRTIKGGVATCLPASGPLRW
jgi:hypothetical protein